MKRIIFRAIDFSRWLALLFFLLLLVLPAVGQETDLRYMAYPAWSTMAMNEKLSFASGVIVGQYGLALLYITDNMDLAGKIPSLYDYIINDYSNSQLVKIVDAVYQYVANRKLPIASIILQPLYWSQKLSLGV